MERHRNLIEQENLSTDELERLESCTFRFARLADMLIQRIFRLIDEIELTGTGTILDRIYRAEKRSRANATEIIGIRELRNLITHEYANYKMPEFLASEAAISPTLSAFVPKVIIYVGDMLCAVAIVRIGLFPAGCNTRRKLRRVGMNSQAICNVAVRLPRAIKPDNCHRARHLTRKNPA